jgi:hypothetical protein
MEKIKRDFKIDYSLDWTYGVDISKIREDLDIIEKLGATRVDIESDESYGSSYVVINAIASRIETDQECKDRLDELKKRQESQKELELKQLETLKRKYES